MNYSLFRNITDPFILQHKRFDETLFKDQKLIEAAQQRKRVTAMTWDLNGQRLITGSSDGYIRVGTSFIMFSLLLIIGCRYTLWSRQVCPRSRLRCACTMMRSRTSCGILPARATSTHPLEISPSRSGM